MFYFEDVWFITCKPHFISLIINCCWEICVFLLVKIFQRIFDDVVWLVTRSNWHAWRSVEGWLQISYITLSFEITDQRLSPSEDRTPVRSSLSDIHIQHPENWDDSEKLPGSAGHALEHDESHATTRDSKEVILSRLWTWQFFLFSC